MRHVEPFIVLFLLPALIGVAAERWLSGVKNAALAATVGTIAVVYVALELRDPGGTWNWLATFLVLPVPVAFALAAVLIRYGRDHARERRRRHGH
jgi:hypothetical protein